MAILKVVIQRSGKSQHQVQMEAQIPKNRMTALVNDRVIAKPEEITALDKSLKLNRQMVFQYCSSVCPAGKYAGYQFTQMDAQTAGMRLIGTLISIDKLLPALSDMLCTGQMTPEMQAKLSQLRLSIMALEVHLNSKTACSSAEVAELREYLETKEKATARTAANEMYSSSIVHE